MNFYAASSFGDLSVSELSVESPKVARHAPKTVTSDNSRNLTMRLHERLKTRTIAIRDPIAQPINLVSHPKILYSFRSAGAAASTDSAAKERHRSEVATNRSRLGKRPLSLVRQ